jgi:hypothetical protein
MLKYLETTAQFSGEKGILKVVECSFMLTIALLV